MLPLPVEGPRAWGNRKRSLCLKNNLGGMTVREQGARLTQEDEVGDGEDTPLLL